MIKKIISYSGTEPTVVQITVDPDVLKVLHRQLDILQTSLEQVVMVERGTKIETVDIKDKNGLPA